MLRIDVTYIERPHSSDFYQLSKRIASYCGYTEFLGLSGLRWALRIGRLSSISSPRL
jgi:hypothetical protein